MINIINNSINRLISRKNIKQSQSWSFKHETIAVKVKSSSAISHPYTVIRIHFLFVLSFIDILEIISITFDKWVSCWINSLIYDLLFLELIEIIKQNSCFLVRPISRWLAKRLSFIEGSYAASLLNKGYSLVGQIEILQNFQLPRRSFIFFYRLLALQWS